MPVLACLAQRLAGIERLEQGYAALAEAAAAILAPRLFSIMLHDAAEGWNLRLHSSQPEVYPPGGRKPVRDTEWTRQLFRRGEPWFCADVAAIRATFPDHALIESLGCGCAMNLPARWRGRTLGTVNLLAEEGRYAAGDIVPGLVLAGLAVPLLQEARRRLG
ncbi:GAF domain-containing protein [Siccirubricoccus sp. KC 17139]|uniref:GAF domain-containing protein n=1 Tax=Siccirubricoccus soli TaxID=2899147 RepID=A0ABT1D717_9PROT|nr:GAF domain-containing protein [Siccirubricoccus soli]MCO6417732.1 GAF domain-containing protein [Siccirubricoccus soli]MCP2683867.1 GAF domain-containing protein [Siccirubricoccus soli]